LPVADDLQLHAIGHQFIEVAFDEAAHQVHQVADFVLRRFQFSELKA
jgi:hypothetical protein